MIDFTITAYRQLLKSLLLHGYSFVRFDDFIINEYQGKTIILRHDVDLLPYNSLRTATIEASMGIRSVYYFRAVPESRDDVVIKAISSYGHEIGYHYESLTTCNGDIDAAYIDFCKNLECLRSVVPVSTICMHGSPRSPYDSKDIWKRYNYKALGLIGEPYLTTDFSKMLYLTDTGRCWDGYKVSVRDKIESCREVWNEKGWSFHTTDDIIKALQENRLPDQLMITTHPQRWFDFGYDWIKELVMQNVKNVAKAAIVRYRCHSIPKESVG